MKQTGRALWGIAFIIVGTIIGFNSLGITDIDIFFKGWWTLFIIVPSFIGLFKGNGEIIGNLIGLIIGFVLLFSVRGIVDFEVISVLFVPFIFIVIGFGILFNSTIKGTITDKIESLNKTEDGIDKIFATFAGQNVVKDNEKFKGAHIDVVFGSAVLDLTKAKLDKETVIKSSAIFGSSKVILPKNVNVKIKSTPIFGGSKNNITNKDDNKTTVYVESFCMFGGFEIK